jgi:cytochrome c-type protein NapB
VSNRSPRTIGFAAVFGISVLTALIAIVAAARDPRSEARGEAVTASVFDEFGSEPIPSEAGVFRTRAAVLAIDPTPGARRSAHPRTLATYRSLRAYPGAPPRIPHGLTPLETLKGGCNTCHEKGGYSQRFGAYVPITPHPEMGACLQCHVGDVKLMSTPLPGVDPSARCRQCHASGALLWRDTSTNWKPLPWPELANTSGDLAPPPIPHSLESRGNCLACHSAPAGVREIRTSHPEQSNCRQCHVETNPATTDFARTRQRIAARYEDSL